MVHAEAHTSLLAPLRSAVALCGVLLTLGCDGCSAPDTNLAVRGLSAEDTSVRVKYLGPLTEEALAARRVEPDVDGVLRLPAGSCASTPIGRCAFAELSVYLKNTSEDALAPPVVRTRAPKGRARRQPLALRAKEVSPGRTGRIRWLVELWPEERKLEVEVSGSVWLEIKDDTPPAEDEAPVEPRAELEHAPAAKQQ